MIFPFTVLESIPKHSIAYKEEFFGPVFNIFKFETEEQAVQIANDS